MPELPEVEATRRYLVSEGLVGRTVTGADLLWPRPLRMPSEGEFKSLVSGRRIDEVRRRAKYLIFDLNGQPHRSLVLHLRMTGSLFCRQRRMSVPDTHGMFCTWTAVES